MKWLLLQEAHQDPSPRGEPHGPAHPCTFSSTPVLPLYCTAGVTPALDLSHIPFRAQLNQKGVLETALSSL